MFQGEGQVQKYIIIARRRLQNPHLKLDYQKVKKNRLNYFAILDTRATFGIIQFICAYSLGK